MKREVLLENEQNENEMNGTFNNKTSALKLKCLLRTSIGNFLEQ